MSLRNKLTIGVMFGMGLMYGLRVSPATSLSKLIFSLCSVVGVMIWRLFITLDPATAADFVYGLYVIGLVSFLEIWLSMIIVSLPVLAPLFRHYIEPVYSHKRTTPGTLREAQHSIGSYPPRRRTDFMYSDIEMGRSNYSAHVKTGMSSSQSDGDDTAELVRGMLPNAITMKREVVVQEGRGNGEPIV